MGDKTRERFWDEVNDFKKKYNIDNLLLNDYVLLLYTLRETPEQRAERITKEDAEKQRQQKKEEEEQAMLRNQLQRKETFEKYKVFIDAMVVGKQKQITYRRSLRKYLMACVDKIFESWGDEYDYIGKFGRGMWDEDFIRKGFNKADQETIIEIAQGFGAFNY